MVGEVIGPHKEAIAAVLLNRDAMIVKLPSIFFYSHKMFLLSFFFQKHIIWQRADIATV